jgi:UDP:flavonoid glycosyltransferase YjiC (YdhE family)
MATILLTWELGGGLGHLTQFLPLAHGLAQRGHRVFAALRHLPRAHAVLGRDLVRYLQAPTCIEPVRNEITPAMTFPHILHNIGFADEQGLITLVEAWRNLYEFVRPDLIIFDHSPTALLAARGFPARRALIGSGFCCPPDLYPLPNLRPALQADPDRLRADEDRVLQAANLALAHFGQPPLERIAQLYAEVDENFLSTFPELDHYPHRQNARYWGPWLHTGGKSPQWPSGTGKRIYAYLKPCPVLPDLLKLLRDLGHPTLVFAHSIPLGIQQRFASATLRFEKEPLDLNHVARECDLAILNGTHFTTISFLLAGKPTLHLPIYLEQTIFARTIARLGTGLSTSSKDAQHLVPALQAILSSDQYAQSAQGFSVAHADFDSAHVAGAMLNRVGEFL